MTMPVELIVLALTMNATLISILIHGQLRVLGQLSRMDKEGSVARANDLARITNLEREVFRTNGHHRTQTT